MIRWLRKKLTPPPIHPILHEIDLRGLHFTCYRFRHRGSYQVKLEAEGKGFTLKVEGEGPTFDAALADAWRKWP